MLAVNQISETPVFLASSDPDIAAANATLANKSPEDIIHWAGSLGQRTLTTTTFGDHSAVLLHMVTKIDPTMQILWIDTGYNTSATYRYAERLIERLDLNIKIYTPKMTSARRNVLMGGIPDVDDPLHEEFTHQVKLEPFQRAIADIQPEVWITGLQREQTEFRKSLEIVSRTKEGFIKVAPLFNWNSQQLESYLARHELPNEADYYDPTKAHDARECGLHTKF